MSMSGSRGSNRKPVPVDGNLRSGLWAVFMGLSGLMVAFVVVAIRWNDESGVAALAAVASSIGAILTAYFGLQLTTQQEGPPARAPRRKKQKVR
jgi:uncharacterized membrane protein YccC